MDIRHATTSDVERLVILNREVQTIHVRIAPEVFCDPNEIDVSDWFKEQIHLDNTYVFVADDNTKIHAYLILKFIIQRQNPFMHPRRVAYIDHVAVSSSKRLSGIGRSLIQHAITFSANHGYRRVELDVWTKNTVAIEVFSHLNFKAKTERLYYESAP